MTQPTIPIPSHIGTTVGFLKLLDALPEDYQNLQLWVVEPGEEDYRIAGQAIQLVKTMSPAPPEDQAEAAVLFYMSAFRMCKTWPQQDVIDNLLKLDADPKYEMTKFKNTFYRVFKYFWSLPPSDSQEEKETSGDEEQLASEDKQVASEDEEQLTSEDEQVNEDLRRPRRADPYRLFLRLEQWPITLMGF